MSACCWIGRARLLLLALSGCLLLPALGAPAASTGPTTRPAPKTYSVNKRICDFSAEDDFSTPEAAYATIIRRWAEGQFDWHEVSTVEARKQNAAGYLDRDPVNAKESQRAVQARIIEVWMIGDHAAVHAEAPDGKIAVRQLGFEGGRWLNAGGQFATDLEDARETTALATSALIPRPPRPPVADPDAFLARCVDYLRTAGAPPEQMILDSLSRHRLTVIGELPHRAAYWAMLTRVVENPAFLRHTGTIYLPLPTNQQRLMEQFLSAAAYDREPAVQIFRELPGPGSPDAAMLEFLAAVWRVNHAAAPAQRLRVVLVDIPRRWDSASMASNVQVSNRDRGRLMAENLLRHLTRPRRDRRGALFVVEFQEAEHLTCSADHVTAIPNGGALLKRVLGAQLFTFLEHGPVMNQPADAPGAAPMPVSPFSRRALGLFDSALKSAGRVPVAFALARSPFAAIAYDADAARLNVTASTYADVFDAYLYLGPYEDERMSPPIEGFYTDAYAKELDRRYKMMNNEGLLAANLGADEISGAALAKAAARTWGQPLGWNMRLEPLAAWRDGDDWRARASERAAKLALSKPDKLTGRAKKILETLRDAKLDKPEKLLALNLGYQPYEEPEQWAEWVCTHLTQTPIKTIELGDLAADALGRPSVPYRLTLSDDSTLEGDLPFVYDPLLDEWEPVEGLDWHLGLDPRARPSTLNPFGQ